MTTVSLGAAFLLGLGSTLHCFAMCGGIIGALSLGVPAVSAPRRALLVAGFNLGRILGYAAAGTLAGAAGHLVLSAVAWPVARTALQLFAAAILVLVGLQLGGWLPGMSWLETLGSRLWRRIQPVGALVLPVDSLGKALIIGTLWGWLPCGLVYFALLWTAALADPAFGAAAMFAFGLGTLPGMMTAGLAARDLSAARRRPGLRRAAALLIVALGIMSAIPAVRDRGAHAHAHH